MPPIGDGIKGSLLHEHFIKVLLGFVIILGITWFSYHRWFKAEQAQIPASQFQATDKSSKIK
jgi:hypothetical protein